MRDSTYVLDGLLYHESDLAVEEHYTDTAGFIDHVFGLMHLLGFCFAPRIRDLGDTKLFITAAIVLWNTVYLERATNALRGHATPVDDALLQYLSPLSWERINLTVDYLWKSSAKVGPGKFRPLRSMPPA